MKPWREASEALERLYALETLRFTVGEVGRRRLLLACAGLCVIAVLGGLSAAAEAVVALATLLAVGALPPLYALVSVWREWSEGTAVWWLALPEPAWLRLAAKASRGLTLGWGLGLLLSLTYMVQVVLGSTFAAQPGLTGPNGLDGLVGLEYGCRLVLYLAFLAVPLSALGAALGLWLRWLRRRPAAAAVLGAIVTVVVLLFGAVTALRNAPSIQAQGVWLPLCLVAAALWWWGCRWLRAGAEVPGVGRG